MSRPNLPDWAAGLDLVPHQEGGYFAETWQAAQRSGDRASGSAIYFLLAAGQRSAWHRVRFDELWLWHRGAPVTLCLGGTGAAPGEVRELRLGPDLVNGERPQLVVPGGIWQSTRPVADAALVTCVVSPGFDYADFELHDEGE